MKEKIGIYTPALLALLTVSAYFFADTVDRFIGMGLFAAPATASAERKPFVPAQSRQLSDYASVLERSLFGDGKRPTAAPAVVRSALYTLVGTVEGGTFSGAVLAVGKDQDFYRMNRRMPDGSAIVSVMRDKVTLRRPNGETVILEKTDDDKIVPVRKRHVATTGVKRLSAGNFAVDQREVLASTENLSQVLTQARALPYLEHGKIAGFRISEIVPGSIYAKIGLQNGDVIQRINSQALDDPGKFFQLYQGLREERNVTIDLIRGGRRQTMNYEIR